LIHRADLHRFLLSKLDYQQILTGKRSVSFQYVHDEIEIIFADASVYMADYLIVADGIHSVIRNQLLPNAEPRYAGYTCWRAVIENKDPDIEISSETWGRKGRFPIYTNQSTAGPLTRRLFILASKILILFLWPSTCGLFILDTKILILGNIS